MKQLELKDYFYHRYMFYGGIESKRHDDRIINNCKISVIILMDKACSYLRTRTNINQVEYLKSVVWKELKDMEKTFEPLELISVEQKDDGSTVFHYYYKVDGQINEVARFNNLTSDWRDFFRKNNIKI